MGDKEKSLHTIASRWRPTPTECTSGTPKLQGTLSSLIRQECTFILFADYLRRKKKKITVLDVRIIAPVLLANQISADVIVKKIGPSPNVGAPRSRHVLCRDDICTEEPPSHPHPLLLPGLGSARRAK